MSRAATVQRRCGRGISLCVAALLLLGGCHRQRVPATLPPVLQAPAVQPPAPAAPAMESPPPESITNAPSVKVTEAKPARRSRKPSAKTVQPPTPVETAAIAPLPPAAVLGALTTGGEVGQQVQQETAGLIALDERRLLAVSGTKAREQLSQLKEVRHFLDQAKEVLASGDAEGAKTLATKAKVLIDDLEKWAAR